MNAEGDRFHAQMTNDAKRAAALALWGVYTFETAAEEFRGLARLHTAHRSYQDYDPVSVADRMLMEELHRQQAQLNAALDLLVDAGIFALRAHSNARRAIAECAAAMAVPVPVYLLGHALDLATTEHRRSESWLKKQAGATR